MPKMIIASRLRDGLVAFMDAAGDWVVSIDSGLLIEDEAEAERLLAVAGEHVAANRIVDPYPIDVTVEAGRRRPSSIREAIRAFGPTVEAGTVSSSAREGDQKSA
jgi:hypothetical protein